MLAGQADHRIGSPHGQNDDFNLKGIGLEYVEISEADEFVIVASNNGQQ